MDGRPGATDFSGRFAACALALASLRFNRVTRTGQTGTSSLDDFVVATPEREAQLPSCSKVQRRRQRVVRGEAVRRNCAACAAPGVHSVK